MIHLNLISPDQKNKLQNLSLSLLVENILGILIIIGAILASAFVPLDRNLNRISKIYLANEETAKVKNKEITTQVVDLNRRVEIYGLVKDQTYGWSDLLLQLSGLTPTGIYLNQFSGSLDNNVFFIRGFAQTRNALLDFIVQLENSEYFLEIESPLSNYLQQENITFEIQGKLIPTSHVSQ